MVADGGPGPVVHELGESLPSKDKDDHGLDAVSVVVPIAELCGTEVLTPAWPEMLTNAAEQPSVAEPIEAQAVVKSYLLGLSLEEDEVSVATQPCGSCGEETQTSASSEALQFSGASQSSRNSSRSGGSGSRCSRSGREAQTQVCFDRVRSMRDALSVLSGEGVSAEDPSGLALNLFGLKLGDDGIAEISAAIATNTHVTSLNLGANRIGPIGAGYLAEALKANSSLTSLNLRGNHLGSDGAKHIAEALEQNYVLTAIDLSGNGITDLQRLSEALRVNQSLVSLQLASNGIGPRGLENLTRASEASSVERLDLQGLNLPTWEMEQQALERIGVVIEKKRPQAVLTVALESDRVKCTTLGGREVAVKGPTDTWPCIMQAAAAEMGVGEDRLKLVRLDGVLLCDPEGTRTLGSLLACSPADMPAEVPRPPPSFQEGRRGRTQESPLQRRAKEPLALPGGMLGCLQSPWLQSCRHLVSSRRA